MIDNLKYYIFGALAIAAAIAITGNKAKADLLNFSLPQIEMVKTDSNKMESSTTAGLIGTYIVMRQMAKSDHEKEERERKDAEAQKKVQDDEKKMSSFDNSAYCRFRIKNSGIDETEVVTFRMMVNRYKQECKKKYLKDHIYLKDFLGYYFSARDDTNDNGADIYLKFTIDFEHPTIISEQDIKDHNDEQETVFFAVCVLIILILSLLAFFWILLKAARE